MYKKNLLSLLIVFFIQGCVAKDQDMYAEQSFQDKQKRSEEKTYIFTDYVGPVIAAPGVIVVGTIQGVGETATAIASNPELMEQGIKTYQQLEQDQRLQREEADRRYNTLIAQKPTQGITYNDQQTQNTRHGESIVSNSTPYMGQEPISNQQVTMTNNNIKTIFYQGKDVKYTTEVPSEFLGTYRNVGNRNSTMTLNSGATGSFKIYKLTVTGSPTNDIASEGNIITWGLLVDDNGKVIDHSGHRAVIIQTDTLGISGGSKDDDYISVYDARHQGNTLRMWYWYK